MTGGPAAGRRRVGRLAALAGTILLLATACGPGGTPSTAVPPTNVVVTSPVDGLLTKLDSEGLTKVTGFRLRTDAGAEVPFTLGVLENGAEFPPGHLAEHMATTTRVRVFFRDEGGDHVVYRLEDAPEP